MEENQKEMIFKTEFVHTEAVDKEYSILIYEVNDRPHPNFHNTINR